MLFNSYEFIFLFLPITIAVFQLLRGINKQFAFAWLTVASIVFYAWWRPVNVFIIVPSILVNFTLARLLADLAGNKDNKKTRKALFVAGIAFNLLVLGYFKYLTFFQATSNELFGTDFVLTYIVLPLGISFITFQEIAFLVDVYGGQIKTVKFREFALFILFFPQLIAGPIVHYREIIPQYRSMERRPDRQLMAVGLTLFCFGVVKKVVLADGIAAHVSPVYAAAAAGEPVSMIVGWVAAVGFTLQIYFDFSGYSDMAAGLALLVGIRLPVNFDSPLKAANIIDFWARWHITLTRFLNAYIYNPVSMSLTRRRSKAGRKPLSPANPKLPGFLAMLAIPTLITMLLSGLWHGAGYTFIVWGGLHGFYLVINHGWQMFGPRRRADRQSYDRIMKPVGIAITFTAVAVSMVLFRAADIEAAGEILQGMFGLNGLGLPSQLVDIGILKSLGWVHAETMSLTQFSSMLGWTAGLMAMALLMPNTLEILAAQKPVLNFSGAERKVPLLGVTLAWRPTAFWLLVTASGFAAVIMKLSGQSEFLYWQF